MTDTKKKTTTTTKAAAERASLAKLAAFEEEAFALDEEEAQPIGVPQNFTRVVGPEANYFNRGGAGPMQAGTRVAGPTFHEGDEWRPGSLSADKIAALQDAMAASGLLRKKYRRGYWEASSVEAYTSLLAFANQVGADNERDALRLWADADKNAIEGTDDKAPFKTLPWRPPDPAAVRLKVKAAFSDLLPREIRDDELDYLTGQAMTLMQQEHDADVGAERAQYDVAGTDKPPAAVPVVDADARFRELLETRYKPQVNLYRDRQQQATERSFIGKSLGSMSSLITGPAA